MKTKKNVLIVTDGAVGTKKMATEIAAVLHDNKVSSKDISEFKGNDILPVDAFFLGCENANPGSFAYLTDLLKHINLAGRSCGVFSSGSRKTTGYLAGLVKDCEAALNPEPLTGSGTVVESWAKSVIYKSF